MSVDGVVEKSIPKDGPGAAVLVVRDHAILHNKGYGLARLGPADRRPITPQTNFRLASLSKQFTAMAIAILVERAHLSLDERLATFFPDLPAKAIKIRHLLWHTAGLRETDGLFVEWGMVDSDGFSSSVSARSHFEPTNADVLTLLKTQPLRSAPPGTKFAYSNTAYACLASVIEAVSGVCYANFLRDYIFQPLGMCDTYVTEGVPPLPANVAHSYDSSGLATCTDIDYSPLNRIFGDDGVFTNLDDLHKWDQALYRVADQAPPPHVLVSDAMLELIFTNGSLNDGSRIPVGFGWYVYDNGTKAEHGGAWAGFRTYIRRYLRSHFTIAILSNYAQISPKKIADDIAAIYHP